MEYRIYVDDVNSHYKSLESKYKTLKQNAIRHGDNEEKLLGLLERRIDSLKSLCDLSIKHPLPKVFKEKFSHYMDLESKENEALSEDLVTLANFMHHDLVESMAEEYELTDHEKTFCACVILDFSREDIRVLFNHTNISSIYNTRCKLREKLGIKGSKVDLIKYIKLLRNKPDEAHASKY